MISTIESPHSPADCNHFNESGIASSPPEKIASPSTEDAVIEAIRGAASHRCAIVPWGGGKSIEQGNPLNVARWHAVSSKSLTGITEYSPDDMVVTARAGTTLEHLQNELATENQFLPLDPPFPMESTLGGIVATNAHGLWRPGYGVPRDLLLGLRAVMADGTSVRAGGKVVKNVAGYDLCKLFAGSWGTLGFITEVTFKTSPKPELRLHSNNGCDRVSTAIDAALRVHLAMLQPIYLTVSLAESVTLSVGLHGSAKAVEWQRDRIGEVIEPVGPRAVEDGPTEDELRHLVISNPDSIRIRISARPTELADLAKYLSQAAGTQLRRLAVQVPSGIIEAALEPSANAVNAVLSVQRRLIGSGFLTWENVPEAFSSQVGDVWGPVRQDFTIMRGIKESLDPNGLFSPGRFVGGL